MHFAYYNALILKGEITAHTASPLTTAKPLDLCIPYLTEVEGYYEYNWVKLNLITSQMVENCVADSQYCHDIFESKNNKKKISFAHDVLKN